MKPSRNTKTSGHRRMKQHSWRPPLKSSWPTIYSDNDMATFLAAWKLRGAPLSYSADNINYSHKSALKSSTPIIRSFTDTDTEDEGFPNLRRFASVSSQGSCYIPRHAASMESLTSYSSLGERSSSTPSPLEDSGFKYSLSASMGILGPDFCDYDQDPKMREAVEEIVSPKPARTKVDKAANLAAMDPSILVALPGPQVPEVPRYSPTNLCDLTVILAGGRSSAEPEEVPRDLDQLRIGTLPVNDGEESLPRVWDIPEEQEEEVSVGRTEIPYRKLSETSDSGDDGWPLPTRDLSLLSSSSSSEIGSRSSSQSSDQDSSSLSDEQDSSDYMADISGEGTLLRRVSHWPPRKKLKLNLREDSTPFALSPRIPGVEYYGVATSSLTESPGQISRGLDAFFNSRSVVHRLGPHGCEQVYEMVACPERCGFAYPVPPK